MRSVERGCQGFGQPTTHNSISNFSLHHFTPFKPQDALAGDKYRSPNFETFAQHIGLRVFSNDDMSILSTSGRSLDGSERQLTFQCRERVNDTATLEQNNIEV
jgi:hypothetical protein